MLSVADAADEAALRLAVLEILAASPFGLNVDPTAVTITSSDTRRRHLQHSSAHAPAQPQAADTSRRWLQSAVTVTVEVTLPSQSDANLAEEALIQAVEHNGPRFG